MQLSDFLVSLIGLAVLVNIGPVCCFRLLSLEV